MSEPDISSLDYFREAKAVRPGGDLKLFDGQIAKYFLLRTGDYSVGKKIKFDIFRHGLRNLQKKFKAETNETLLMELAKSTKFMISLPFRVIFDLYMSEDSPRYDGTRYDTMTRVYSSTLNNLLAYPKDTLKSFGVSLKGLKFTKLKFPKGIKLNNFELNSFPVLIVEDEGSKAWKKKFEEFIKNRTNAPTYFEQSVKEMLDGTLFEKEYFEKEFGSSPTIDEDIPF